MFIKNYRTFFFLSLAILFENSVWSQCETIRPTSANFEKVSLVDNLSYPLELAVAEDGRVFYVEKNGTVGMYTPGGGVQDILSLDVVTNLQVGYGYGLVGIALDPNFSGNNWIYLFYFPDTFQKPTLMGRLSRFTLDGNVLIESSEKILLEIPFNGFDHAGGSLAFDHEGNLYLSTGDDTEQVFSQAVPLNWAGGPGFECDNTEDCALDAARTAGNTNDLRGKILRIKPLPIDDSESPTPGVGSTYMIPEGNLFPVGTDSTRAEIYTMGHRNAYRYGLDPVTGWMFLGDPGGYPTSNMQSQYPDLPYGHDEFHIAKGAGNYGWPFFAADNKPYAPINFSNNTLSGDYFDPSQPALNGSPRNTGKREVPLAVPAEIFFVSQGINSYSHNYFANERVCAPLGGPVYRYGSYNGSTSKLPPYYDGKWFITSSDMGFFGVVSFDESGVVTDIEDFPLSGFSTSILDMAVGPDGAMYISSYTSVFKIEYNGSCLPIASNKSFAAQKQADVRLHLGGDVLLLPAEYDKIEIFSLTGKKIKHFDRGRRKGELRFSFSEQTRNDVLLVKLQ